MSYVVYLDERKKLILRPDCIAMCPALMGLDDREVLVIALIYDNYSTLRRYNESDRIRRAILQIYENDNNPKLLSALEDPQPNHRITNAVNAYKSLQYDPKVALMNKYQQMINDLQEKMSISDGNTALKNNLASMELLRKSIQGLENEITDDVISQGVLKGDQENSLLEIWQKNRKLYQAMFEKKK